MAINLSKILAKGSSSWHSSSHSSSSHYSYNYYNYNYGYWRWWNRGYESRESCLNFKTSFVALVSNFTNNGALPYTQSAISPFIIRNISYFIGQENYRGPDKRVCSAKMQKLLDNKVPYNTNYYKASSILNKTLTMEYNWRLAFYDVIVKFIKFSKLLFLVLL